jgi:hypothetical protein
MEVSGCVPLDLGVCLIVLDRDTQSRFGHEAELLSTRLREDLGHRGPFKEV